MSFFKNGCTYVLIDAEFNDSIVARGNIALVLEDRLEDVCMRWVLTDEGKVRRAYLSSILRRELV